MSKYLISSIFERDNSDVHLGDNLKEKISLLQERKPYTISSSWLPYTSKHQRVAKLWAIQNIEKEFDVAHFVKQQKYFQVIMQVLFSRHERFLIRKNRRLTIVEDGLNKNVKDDEQTEPGIRIDTVHSKFLLAQAFRKVDTAQCPSSDDIDNANLR